MIRAGTAITATLEKSKVCFLFIPPIISIKKVKKARHIVTLILGSIITSRQRTPATINAGISPLKVLTLS